MPRFCGVFHAQTAVVRTCNAAVDRKCIPIEITQGGVEFHGGPANPNTDAPREIPFRLDFVNQQPARDSQFDGRSDSQSRAWMHKEQDMHLTVRMAWHDHGWDGRVCQDPRRNTYCSGAHSLLSGRIEKRKNTELEETKKGMEIAGQFYPATVPPCYWSLNAFGSGTFKVEHQHPLSSERQPIRPIADTVKPFSVFTWPFKLSFVHNSANQKVHGNYPPDLEQRVERFIDSFTPQQSILFFYANYDNPVSADDMKYLLVGCSLISEVPVPTHFDLTKEELKEWRERGKAEKGRAKKMKNFPTMNWAIQFTHDPATSVLLPYTQYLQYADEHPEDEGKLDDMKVVIEEESLVRAFKYVAMDIDDDKCLYLLYKLRKAIRKIESHNRLVVDMDMSPYETRLHRLIQMTWEKRGSYPALGRVLNHFIHDEARAEKLAAALSALTTPKSDLLELFQRLMAKDVPAAIEAYEDDLLDLAENRLFKKNLPSLVRLSLFNLTSRQVARIIEDANLFKEIASNPYALYEEYVPEEDDLDVPQLKDEPIDVYKIDVGMLPDPRCAKRHRKLQSLAADSPERVRSVYIDYLSRLEQQGHCYDQVHNLVAEIKGNPLIYQREDITIDEKALIHADTDYKSHFIQKLHIVNGDNVDFYYLKRLHEAEQYIRHRVNDLLKRSDHPASGFNTDAYVETSLNSDALKTIVTAEEHQRLFREERQQLYGNVFCKSLFLLTGKPGSGKTFETSQIVEHLTSLHEEVMILTPTGKAALRVNDNIRANTTLKIDPAKTIDKWLYERFADVMNGDRALDTLAEKEKITVQNLIIDESSMLDLEKLHLLFSVIRFTEKAPKRIIFVGDENQLPPIGFGKPFHDMIAHVLSDTSRASRHYINLTSNCRQENDPNILALAETFTDKHRYRDNALALLDGTGWVSSGLYVQHWSDANSLGDSIREAMHDLFRKEMLPEDLGKAISLNRLFGLYDNGNVNNQDFAFRERLKLEDLQLLSPYRSGYYGTLGLNKWIQSNYRERPANASDKSPFYHADKIIRLANWYQGWGANRKLVLSNGSIGICKGDAYNRQYYFKELERPLTWAGDEEDYDLGYAISVHRSQGSDFRNVFMIIPKKRALLSRELLYTALTRSKVRLFLFIQNEENLLDRARSTSHLLGRNTSIFQAPCDHKASLIPDPQSKPVKSRIEYIIYQALKGSGLKFVYERRLSLSKRDYPIHPDFTIELRNGQTVYWEHLGMLDVRKYYRDWQQRIVDYRDHGLFDQVVTTDDLSGIKQERIDAVIEAIRDGQLRTDSGNRFSTHHYELY
jgi:exodeoxyribonuclease V alpha subunit